MRRIKLILTYDGTEYSGWQEQPGVTTVQGTVEAALAGIIGRKVRVQSAGRTDAGVHAVAMPAVFDDLTTIPLRAFVEGLNSKLPSDIAVVSAEVVDPSFMVIGGAVSKTYRYTLYLSRLRNPLYRRSSWHVPYSLDFVAMELAAKRFIGTHDFAAFRGQNCTAATTIRRIDSIAISVDGPLMTIDVSGGGFLKNMVRIIVGTLVDIGRGRFCESIVTELLLCPDRTRAGVTAPPHGLCLMSVRY